MIHINLLPEEYRRKARTPIKITLAVAGVACVNALLLTWFAWLALGVRAEIESERAVLQTELDGLTPQVAYHRALESERKSFAAREETLASITQNRINWTRKLDELITVINTGGEGTRHYVWLDDLNVTQSSDPRSKGGGSVRASGHSGSDKFEQIANFLEDLEKSPFVREFQPPAPPEGSESSSDKELIPAVVWSFPLQLDLKTPEERSELPSSPDGESQEDPAAQPTGDAESAGEQGATEQGAAERGAAEQGASERAAGAKPDPTAKEEQQ